jgi:phosphoglycerate dehydrogenase-like enzyme
MGEDQLHIVFGTGQVGNALAAHLAGLGMAVRAVSRHRPLARVSENRGESRLFSLVS